MRWMMIAMGLIDDQTTIYTMTMAMVIVRIKGDCDDNIAQAPNLTEICGNGVDDNGNGTEDEINAIDCIDYYHDADGDGYGGSFYPSECWCEPGGNSGMLNVTEGGDCMDNTMPSLPMSTLVRRISLMWIADDGSFDYDCEWNRRVAR